jgi:3-hydroxyacyl-[acyl-carrier-protein] dehydratase
VHQQTSFELQDILPILPHRPPFLFVDRVRQLEAGKSIIAERTLRPEEPQFAGHFPGRPTMPGVLVTEALAQTCGLLVGLSDKLTNAPPRPRDFVLARTNLKFTHPAVPGDVLELHATIEQSLGGVHAFQVRAVVGDKVVASGSLSLALTRSAA